MITAHRKPDPSPCSQLPRTAAIALWIVGAALGQEPLYQRGWCSWRGPLQTGASLETSLPESIDLGGKETWTFELCGRGTPVVSGGKVYAMGYQGEKADLQEMLVCLEARSGKKVWDHRFTDLPTDTIYNRYGIGSPTVCPKTGNVYCMSTAGLLCGFTADGKLLWQRSMMEEYGRLTFPNGRTGAPLIVDGQVIVHVVTSAWGAHGPARDRFYSFDLEHGLPLWSSTPGGPPIDISFSFPVIAEENGRKVLYAGLGGGHLVSVVARTGTPVWRRKLSIGGLSTSPLIYKDTVLMIHGKENIDSSTIGRMVAIRPGTIGGDGKQPVELTNDCEVWRNDLVSFTSSPVLVGDRVYLTDHTGELHCVAASSGALLWHQKLAPDQIHASPAYGAGKLYVPMNNGSFHIVDVRGDKPKVLQQVQLEGNCLGAPAIADGGVYVHTTRRLYRFGGHAGSFPAEASTPTNDLPRPGEILTATRLVVTPADIVLRQGDSTPLRAWMVTEGGGTETGRRPSPPPQCERLPPGVKVQGDRLVVAADAPPTAVIAGVAAGNQRTTMRLRIVPQLPINDDFSADLIPHPKDKDILFGPPRPYWVGAGLKWEIRKLDGECVLAKTLDNPLFQRTMSFFGHPEMRDYTMQVDICSDGNRRMMSSAGVVHQRYLIVLKGNHQELEVSSNMELLKVSVPFRWKPKVWHRLKTRVDIEDSAKSPIPGGAAVRAVVRAKVWPRDGEEPANWTIEVPHAHPHRHGAPGVYGFVPQSRFMVYLDNLSVTQNTKTEQPR